MVNPLLLFFCCVNPFFSSSFLHKEELSLVPFHFQLHVLQFKFLKLHSFSSTPAPAMDSPYENYTSSEYYELSALQQSLVDMTTDMEWSDIATPKMSSSSFSLDDELYGPSSTRVEQLGSTGIAFSALGGGDDASAQQLVVVGDNDAIINTLSPEKRSSHQMIGLEDLKQHFGKPRAEAAKCLQVSISTFRRACKKHRISPWPYNRKKKNMVLSAEGVDKGLLYQITSSSSYMQPEPETEIQPPPEKERDVIVKVQYGDNFIKFEISSLLKVADLKVEISKRLKLKVGSFDIKYLDDEGDWIWIKEDVDLSLSMRSVEIKTIKMMVLPCSN